MPDAKPTQTTLKRKVGRPTGITKKKVTVTINEQLERKTRRLAGKGNTTMSAIIQMALQQYLTEAKP